MSPSGFCFDNAREWSRSSDFNSAHEQWCNLGFYVHIISTLSVTRSESRSLPRYWAWAVSEPSFSDYSAHERFGSPVFFRVFEEYLFAGFYSARAISCGAWEQFSYLFTVPESKQPSLQCMGRTQPSFYRAREWYRHLSQCTEVTQPSF